MISTNSIKKVLNSEYFYHIVKNKILNIIRPPKIPEVYPLDINIEVTSFCNSKCKFCTHESLINAGLKKQYHMDYDLFTYTILKIKRITSELGILSDKLSIGLVGLGEPFLYPRFFEALSYTRKIFPKAMIHANSNCIVLKGKILESLIGSELDTLVLSLGFNNPVEYKNWYQTNKYETVRGNIKQFLILKGNKSPKAVIHIFNKNLNRNKFRDFYLDWKEFLGANNFIRIESYIPMVEGNQNNKPKYPCSQLWTTIMIDNEGYLFPCCLGVWSSHDDEICLGHIKDDYRVWFRRLKEIRLRHLSGDYRTCNNCGYLIGFEGYLKIFYSQVKKFHKEYSGLENIE
jgi:MoaA/NifB/PqqE/SkfB family radical SAM enzyme